MKTKIVYLFFVLFTLNVSAQTAAENKKVVIRELPV